MWLARFFYLSAALAALHLLLGRFGWVDFIGAAADTVLVPVRWIGAGFIAFYVVLGMSLSRRKRLGWWFAFGLVFFVILVDVAAAISVVVSAEVRNEPGMRWYAGQAIINAVCLTLVLVALVRARPVINGRIRVSNVWAAALTLVGGWALSLLVAVVMLKWHTNTSPP